MWYGFGWWWWWIAFLVIFFLLPVGYGWGYRGWGPWYQRRRRISDSPEQWSEGWEWGGILLWIILIIAIIWLIFAWGWGTY